MDFSHIQICFGLYYQINACEEYFYLVYSILRVQWAIKKMCSVIKIENIEKFDSHLMSKYQVKIDDKHH